jgi:hypothetical protein
MELRLCNFIELTIREQLKEFAQVNGMQIA